MNKICLIFVLYLVLFTSCKKNCNDCGPITTGSYFFKNATPADLTLVFYGNATVSWKRDSLRLKSNERKQFLYFSTGIPSSSALTFDYHLCDSLHILNNDSLLFRSFGLENCKEWHNVLCVENYSVVNEEIINKGKYKGGKNIEYELILK